MPAAVYVCAALVCLNASDQLVLVGSSHLTAVLEQYPVQTGSFDGSQLEPPAG
jgi:hypothetical protein